MKIVIRPDYDTMTAIVGYHGPESEFSDSGLIFAPLAGFDKCKPSPMPRMSVKDIDGVSKSAQ
ncbi:MAG: hypothetical protein LBQ76_08605 [Candidatus Fibromonas sp.]|nr:hypothetical protein [Candidatus Fibromonas sp.]